MDKSPNICFVSIGANGSAIAADMIAAGIEMSCFDPWPSHVEAIQIYIKKHCFFDQKIVENSKKNQQKIASTRTIDF